jgi:hypothetical protein
MTNRLSNDRIFFEMSQTPVDTAKYGTKREETLENKYLCKFATVCFFTLMFRLYESMRIPVTNKLQSVIEKC